MNSVFTTTQLRGTFSANDVEKLKPVSVDSWAKNDDCFNVVVAGRITLQLFWELNYDFLPNYCFNAATNR
jgi:hypothetical protein